MMLRSSVDRCQRVCFFHSVVPLFNNVSDVRLFVGIASLDDCEALSCTDYIKLCHRRSTV